MSANNVNDFENLQEILNLCEEINQQPIVAEEEEENFNNFFRICENMLENAVQEQVHHPEEPAIRGGNGHQERAVQEQGQLQEEPVIEEGNGRQERFRVIAEIENHVRRFRLRGRRVTFQMLDPPEIENPVAWFKDSVAELVNYVIESVPAADMVGMIFNTPRLQSGPAWLSFRRADQLHVDTVWESLSRILQSNAEIFADGQFTIELTRVSMPAGRGKHLNANGLTYAELCRRKYGIVEIDNSDRLCLPRALVVAESWAKKEDSFRDVVKDRDGMQGIRARELLFKSGVNIGLTGAGIPELIEFQKHFQNYNIVVYEYNGRGSVIFEGAKDKNLPRLNILYHQNHFNVIKSLPAAFSSKYFCEPCHKPYNSLANHKCANKCSKCLRAPACPPNEQLVLCAACKRHFRGQNCFNNHASGLCKIMRMCDKCLKIYNPTKHNHVCGEIYCALCTTYKPVDHACYIRQDKKPSDKKYLFIYYDLETRQEKIVGTDKVHEVNLCVAQQSCNDCCNIEDIKLLCSSCGIRQHIFKTDCIAKFVEYVLLPRTSFSTVTCIAHNAKNFDSQFILKYLAESMNLKPKLILNGTKIMLMEINSKVRFIDSINYLPMSLASLPKAMDLPSTLKKGYFPHFFNKLENQAYIGPLPGVEYYGADTMNCSQREKFLAWHTEQTNNNLIFSLQKELVEYCISDVDILRRSCDKFRKTFIEDCNVCPFSEAVTIASACNKVFRRQFLKPNTIGIIPLNGYRLTENVSKISLQWLIYEEKRRGIRLEHAGRGKEAVLRGGLKVDGYYRSDKLVFEFMGCFWHGCTLCYRTSRDKTIYNNSKESLNMRFERTQEKIYKLKALGYTVEVMWECEFRKILKQDQDIQNYVDQYGLTANLPLHPRDAFFGGRTGNVTLYRKTEGEEKIKYVDVCSLYPYVCKYGKYPVGHPKIFVGAECNSILGPDNNIDQVEGLIKCTVLPPNNLFHPVLPRKIHNKLMFVLCRTCCDEYTQSDCVHTDEERQFLGTWVVDEVRRAVTLGYVIIEVHEIWQYKVTVHDRVTKSGGLFAEYINNFLKMKQEASGYPSECIDDEAKQEYVEEYFRKEGVLLDTCNIEKNAGKRSLAKLMLNSFWGNYNYIVNLYTILIYYCNLLGKFAQAENKTQTTMLSTPEELYDLLANPAVEVHRIIPAGDRVIYTTWKLKDEAKDQLRTVNVVIAAYTTAQARLRLHEFLHPLGKRVLYYDTDSVIYSHDEGQYEPPLGNFLGDLTDELSSFGEGSYITEFVCGGPKNYAYKVFCPSTCKTEQVCKVKGFTLNYKNMQIINFDLLKQMILNDTGDAERNRTIIISENIRTTAEHEVVTRREKKSYNINFTKRRLINNFESLPYGYKKPRLD